MATLNLITVLACSGEHVKIYIPRDLVVCCYNSMNILRATANTKPAATLSYSWQLIIIDLLLAVKRRARLDHV